MNYRKILFYISLVTGVIIISLALSMFLFKDRIIRQFVLEANKHINTPIKLGKIDVSIFQNFPHLSIVLTDVYIEDSYPGEYPLLTAKRLSFKMNPWDVYRGRYKIHGLEIDESETTFKLNDQGENNYTILKSAQTGDATKSSVDLELRNVKLRNTKFSYLDLKTKQHLIFTSHDLQASIRSNGILYDIEADGQLTTEQISVEGKLFLTGKSFLIESKLQYDDAEKKLAISPSTLELNNKSTFLVNGNYGWKEKNEIDIKVAGKDTDIQTLLSLLPESVSGQFAKYRSKGDVYFSSVLQGEISDQKWPSLNITFGFNDATIYHPDFKSKISGASLKGSFSSNDLSNAKKTLLTLHNIKGRLNNEPFIADFIIRDFTNPDVNCSFKGNVDAAAVFDFFPVENINKINGRILADIAIRGRIELLKNRTTAQQVSTQGTIELKDINFLYGAEKVPLKNLSGSLQFSNNDLALSNVGAQFGNSDFLFNGFFKNIITFLLFENQPVGIETDLRSRFLDVNQLLAIGFGTSSTNDATSTYQFSISKNVYLNFNCDIDKLSYKRFNGQKIKGDLLVKNKVAVSRKLSLKTMGGNLTLSGIVDANNPKAIDVVCTSKLTGIHLDSVFYVFENFDQQFIQDKHLKGQVTADVNFELVMSESLKMFPETMVADISAVIRNGELNNFEPLKKLNRFLDDEGLNHLRFSDLQNDIHIEKKVIYIPQMEIGNNVTDISISGTHTFDQQINYRLSAPLRGKSKLTGQQTEGALDTDSKGQTKLYLKIHGTTDDYKIGLDTDAIKKKIVSDFKKEVKELKNAFKKQEEQKKKEVQVQDEEYFDW